MTTLQRRVEFLEAERTRLEGLLALSLRVACGGTSTTPTALLSVLCEVVGTDPARAAFIEARREGSR
jgi:hypothetical protein